MDLNYIFESFKKLELNVDKAGYLKELEKMNLPYDINFDNLIKYWERKAARDEARLQD